MLTKEQYIKNMEDFYTFAYNIDKSKFSEGTKEYENILIKKAKEFKLKYLITKQQGFRILAPRELPEYQELVVTKEVIVPREERQSSCDIAILSKNFRDQMLSSIDYTNDTNREVHYTLCETPKGKRMSSPSFGSEAAVTPRQGKCQREFGEFSNEIAEFHTHPGKYVDKAGFSGGDLLSYYNRPPEKINCVVREVKSGNTRNVRVRCAKSQDVQNFLMSSEWKKSKDITDENAAEFEDALEGLGERTQDKFSCFVDFPLSSQYKDISQLKKEEKKRKPSLYKKLYGTKRRGFPL